MKKFLPLIIVSLIAFIVWALLGFPLDFDLVSTKIFSALSLLSMFFAIAKGIKENFFDKPITLSDSANPIMVQIVKPKKKTSPSTASVDSLKRIRALAPIVSRDQIIEDVAIILGDKSEIFWKAVDANPKAMLSSLAGNGFMLEGLILVFEENNGSFPENASRILSQILLHQWNSDKIGIKGIVSLDVLKKQLGNVAQRNYPGIRYPNDYARSIYPSPYSKYERLVYSIGKKQIYINFEPYRIFWRWFFTLFSKDKNFIFDFAEKFAGPSRGLILLPFYIPLILLSLLKNLITLPFILLERMVESYVRNYKKISTFHDHLDSWWYQYRHFKLRTHRFFDLFSITRALNIRRGKVIIESAKTAGILDSDGEHIWFTHEYWLDYFTACNLVYTNSLDNFLRQHVRDRYRRQDPYQKEKVAIMASGLYQVPVDCVELVFKHDPIAASKCLLTLNEIPLDTQDNLKKRLLDKIVQNLKEVEQDGNSLFCIDSIRAMRSLSDAPYYANVALEKIPEIYDFSYRPAAAKLVASFGWPVFDMLLSRLTVAHESEKTYILIALGELKDPRSISKLRELLRNGDEPLTKVLAAIILATYYDDEEGSSALEKYLRYEVVTNDKNKNEGDWAWYYFDFCGEKAIEFALGVLERASKDTAYLNAAGYAAYIKEDRFLRKLEKYRENAVVENLLLDTLRRADNIRIIRLLAKAFGEVKSQSAVPELIRLLRHEDDSVRELAIGSLAQIDNKRLGNELIGLLYSSNPTIVAKTIGALGAINSIEAIPALIKKLTSDEFEGESDYAFPIALSAAYALASIGKNIPDNNDASQGLDAAIEWSYNHLSDKSLVRNHQTVSYKAVGLLNYEINTEKSRKRYSEWLTEHPEDQS